MKVQILMNIKSLLIYTCTVSEVQKETVTRLMVNKDSCVVFFFNQIQVGFMSRFTHYRQHCRRNFRIYIHLTL